MPTYCFQSIDSDNQFADIFYHFKDAPRIGAVIENEVLAKDNSDKISEIYSKYHQTVNMGYDALKKWAENPCSKVASLSRGPINRNLSLLSKRRDEWNMSDVRSANRTISFVSRMKGVE